MKTHHFDLAFDAFVADEATQDFIHSNNRHGFDELLAKFDDAAARLLDAAQQTRPQWLEDR